jgi:hypothetical protein
MELENNTPFAARLLRLPRGEDSVHGTLLVKSTFDVSAAGRLTPSQAQMPVLDAPFETDFGIFHGEGFIAKDGVDVCVLGSIQLEAPVTETRISLHLQAKEWALQVFGDRRWRKRGDELVSSDPEPFTTMPLSYRRAYGGTTEHDYEVVTWADNPHGCGHYLTEEGALGGLLPNIEADDGPRVAHWIDQPEVAGWAPYPMFWGLRAREGVDVSKVTRENPLPRIRARLNNHAHPALVLPELEPCAVLSVRGARAEELWFPLPALTLYAGIDFGGTREEVSATLDGVFVWLDAGRLTLTHRCHFDYEYRRGERRVVRLFESQGV